MTPNSPIQTVSIVSKTRLGGHWGSLTDYEVALERADGTGQTMTREVYDHGSAAAVLPCDPRRGTVLLVRQLRVPVHVVGDKAMLIEACAGLLDGDDPQTCAIREAEEETGYRISGLELAFSAFMSPGSVTEKVWCFLARYDASQRLHAGGGLAEEGEEIEVLELPFDEAFGMIGSGEIVDAKTIMLLQHAKLGGIFG